MKEQILNFLSTNPYMCVEEFFDEEFDKNYNSKRFPNKLFKALEELDSENKIKLIRGEMGYVKLIS
jgi:hypothetical protein